MAAGIESWVTTLGFYGPEIELVCVVVKNRLAAGIKV